MQLVPDRSMWEVFGPCVGLGLMGVNASSLLSLNPKAALTLTAFFPSG